MASHMEHDMNGEISEAVSYFKRSCSCFTGD